jgi:signal transduction histidine kinase
MADVATGVLHNVGNVLTSVNITAQDLLDRLRTSRISLLQRIVETIQKERPRLAAFFTEDPAGQRFPEFLAKLETHLREENAGMRTDVESLIRHFVHIREVILTQQSSAKIFGVMENVPPEQLIEDALKLNSESLERHGIALVRNFAKTVPARTDRHKVLQILVNLLKNAKDSLLSSGVASPTITVSVAPAGPNQVAVIVADNGLGIPAENLARIFSHGFTTKKNGHGFGLHSCVLAARDMQGDLTVASEGAGRGAVFTLILPAGAS